MFNISFKFDEVTKKITNVIIEEEKTQEQLLTGAWVSVDKVKLVFSKEALQLLCVNAGDCVSINYYTVNNEETFPVISKTADLSSGNKVTKSNTVSFRGEQRKTLLKFGENFKIEPFKDEFFKLTPINLNNEEEEETAIKEVQNSLNNFENVLNFLKSEEETVNVDLPF